MLYFATGQELIRIFKSKLFARFVRKNSIRNSELCQAINDLMAGLIDADLGSGVFKQRIARQGQGKSGGFRSIILFRHRSLAFFVHGFAKSDVANITPEDLQQFRKLAGFLLQLDADSLEIALAEGRLIEVNCGQKDI